MLKLFFVTAILTAVVKSEDGFDGVDWICPSINQWGNCSFPPNIPQLLRMMEGDSNTNRYSDIYYCPYNIAKRHSMCIHTFYLSCSEHLTTGDRTSFSANLPKLDEPSFCATDRAYKKEFIEHMACIKVLVQSNDQNIEVPFKQLQQYLEQDMLKYDRMKLEELKSDTIDGIGILHDRFDQMKCQYLKQYMQLQYTQIRSVCGSKTEKFFRQLSSNTWPMSLIPKNCESNLLHYKS
ncbi:uncharacterized protein LOC132941692 [Metopolophium dirhodum]|uniref:uncharacterized protein LOC132941692 n=1 Tax=Metopolophium dirhodum TaxID=44670 RepID=UPI00299006E5|nr:uncharacterized protein LOC132941692 [Metopolophium dirhodum]